MAVTDFIPLVGPALDFGESRRANRKSREFTEKMYSRQVADAERFWSIQNEYNLPSNQMSRLKAAGLNPNLVYGSGTSTVAGDISRPSPQSHREMPFQAGAGAAAGISSHIGLRLADAEIALKQAQTTKMLAEADSAGSQSIVIGNTIDAQIRKINAESLTSEVKFEMDAMARNVQQEMMRRGIPLHNAIAGELYNQLRNRKVDVDIKSVEAATRRTDVMRELDQAELALRKSGNSFRDPLYLRHLGAAMEFLMLIFNTR